MKNRFCILILLVIMLATGCKTTEHFTDKISQTMMLRIRGTGDMYSQVLEAMHKVKYLQVVSVTNENDFFEQYQQLEITIDLLNPKQYALLQVELMRIPEIITVTIL